MTGTIQMSSCLSYKEITFTFQIKIKKFQQKINIKFATIKIFNKMNTCLGIFYCVALFASSDAQACNNIFNGKIVRASGNWSPLEWSSTDPFGLMKFDDRICAYTLAVGRLERDKLYKWKVFKILRSKN